MAECKSLRINHVAFHTYLYGCLKTTLANGAPRPGSWMISLTTPGIFKQRYRFNHKLQMYCYVELFEWQDTRRQTIVAVICIDSGLTDLWHIHVFLSDRLVWILLHLFGVYCGIWKSHQLPFSGLFISKIFTADNICRNDWNGGQFGLNLIWRVNSGSIYDLWK